MGATVAAAQAAFSLVSAEYGLAAGQEAVALKSRSASLTETYAQQSNRVAAILPYTSALAGLCAATCVATVEFLPFAPSVFSESFVCTLFPSFAGLFAAAASISRACSEI